MKNEKGFTLVELLVAVVVIFLIIAGIIGLILGLAYCKGCGDSITYSECVESCAQLEGEELEKACLERCD